MILITYVISLLGLTILYTLLVKLSAFLLSRIHVTWKYCIMYSVIVTIIGFSIGRVLPIQNSVPLIVACTVFLICLNLVLGGWFFRDRARDSSGQFIGSFREI